MVTEPLPWAACSNARQPFPGKKIPNVQSESPLAQPEADSSHPVSFECFPTSPQPWNFEASSCSEHLLCFRSAHHPHIQIALLLQFATKFPLGPIQPEDCTVVQWGCLMSKQKQLERRGGRLLFSAGLFLWEWDCWSTHDIHSYRSNLKSLYWLGCFCS